MSSNVLFNLNKIYLIYLPKKEEKILTFEKLEVAFLFVIYSGLHLFYPLTNCLIVSVFWQLIYVSYLLESQIVICRPVVPSEGAVKRLPCELSAFLQGQRHGASMDRWRAGHAGGEGGHGRGG